MGERPWGGLIPWLLEDGAMDGGPNLDLLGAARNGRGQHEWLRVHAPLGGEVAAAQPDVVPPHLLDRVHLFPVLGVRRLFQKLPTAILGVPGNFVSYVHGIPGGEKSKVHTCPSCVARCVHSTDTRVLAIAAVALPDPAAVRLRGCVR